VVRVRARSKSKRTLSRAEEVRTEARILERIYREDLRIWPRELLWELLAWGNPLAEEVVRERRGLAS
jgi:hypothetical protein